MNRIKLCIALLMVNAGMFVVIFALQPKREGLQIVFRTGNGEPFHYESVWNTPSFVVVGTLLMSAAIFVVVPGERKK